MYSTSELAKIINVHPNTIRFYESVGIITHVNRKQNGYRIFTEFHKEQIELAKLGLSILLTHNDLRKDIFEIIKISGSYEFDKALIKLNDYQKKLNHELTLAKDAITNINKISRTSDRNRTYKRKEAAETLLVTIDTLRNWELNGLFKVKKRENGYRIYDDEDLIKLLIIKTLRNANFSLQSILRLVNQNTELVNEELILNILTFSQEEDVKSATDQLILSLINALEVTDKMKKMIESFKIKPYSITPMF